MKYCDFEKWHNLQCDVFGLSLRRVFIIRRTDKPICHNKFFHASILYANEKTTIYWITTGAYSGAGTLKSLFMCKVPRGPICLIFVNNKIQKCLHIKSFQWRY